MTVSTTGTSVKGRQVLGTTATNDRYYSLVITNYNDSAPLVRRLGYFLLEQDIGSGDWRQVDGAALWTNGILIERTFNQVAPLRCVCQWDIAGLPWALVSAGTPL